MPLMGNYTISGRCTSDLRRQVIKKVGAQLIYLRPYHPELNPIEEMWSKVKNMLRKLSARNLSDFQKARPRP